MVIYLYFKSGQCCEFTPQIRLTHSKNKTTGTAIYELNFNQILTDFDFSDPIYGIGLKKDSNSIRMADICHFVWSCGKPIKLIAIFIFSNLEEKQTFFNYYEYYAFHKSLEFFPAIGQEKTLAKQMD